MRFLGPVTFTLLSVVVLQGPLSGQSTSNPPLLQAVQPFQSYDGGDLDSVNLATGMLSIHIPIVSFPQRGAMHLDYSFGYTNPSATPVIASTPAGDFGTYTVTSAGLPFTNNAFPIADYTIDRLPCTGCTTYTLALIDGTGTSHPLKFINAGSQARTVDGTGYLVNSPLAATCTIIDRNGIKTAWGGSIITATDPNGNQMTEASAGGFGCYSTTGPSAYFSAGAITDTMGRHIPAVSEAPLAPNANGQFVQNSTTWTVPGPNGGTSTYQFTSSGSAASLILPDLAAFSFNFVAMQLPLLARQTTAQTVALLHSITLPNGGTISYGYGTLTGVGAAFSIVPVTSRTVNANDGTGPHTWTYQYVYSYNSSTGSTTLTTTVTDPIGNVSIHTYPYRIPFESEVQEKDPGGNLLRTMIKSYGILPLNDGGGPKNINGNPASVTTIWPNGQQNTVSMTYDADNGSGFAAGAYFVGPGEPGFVPDSEPSSYTLNAWGMSETDYGNGASGPVLRTTFTSYHAFSNAAYLANNLLDLPQSVQVEDGSGNQRSYTIFGYDEASLQSSGVTQQKVAGEPDAGNQTSVHRWLSNGSAVSQPSCNVSVTSGNYLVTNYTYFDTGDVQEETDPCLHSTSYLYSSSYFGAYPTTVTNSLGQKTTYSYDINTGSLLSTSDPNSNTTTNSYDIMGRLAGTTYSDGGSTSYCYTDIGGATCTQASAPPYSVVTTQALSSSVKKVSTNVFDGIGRVLTAQLTSDPAGVSTVATTYDALGRIQSISNPYRSTGEATYGITSYLYDGLNRKIDECEPGGSNATTCNPGASGTAYKAWSYIGNQVTYSDENRNQWQRTSDALGRLTGVVEPSGAATTYGYDVLGNLLSVNQRGTSSETPRNRSFAYDSLSRLTTSTNPETGTVSYGYDADGNLTSKTDARGVTINYSYDSLNRETSKQAPGINYTYSYDASTGPTFASANAIGRMTEASNNVNASEEFSYDSLGRINAEQYVIPDLCCGSAAYPVVSATYNLAGDIASLTYPDGRVVNQIWDGGGHLAQITDGDGYSYLTPQSTYWPNGAPQGLSYGNGLANGYHLNSRQQIDEIGAVRLGSQAPGTYTANNPLSVKEYCYGPATSALSSTIPGCPSFGKQNSGSIWQVMDTLNGGHTQSFSYDSLDRITSFARSDGSMQQTYAYDSFGNLNQTSPGTLTDNLGFNANNQISSGGYGYDAAGNVTSIYNGVSTTPYGYDAESKLVNVSNGAATYTYDANGDRVRKDTSPNWTEYVNFNGEALAEKKSDGTWSDYIFANGRRIARVDNYDVRIHMSGTNCTGTGCAGAYQAHTTLPSPPDVIQAGDLLTWRQYQDGGAVGGLVVEFSDTSVASQVLKDSDGQYIDTDSTTGRWHERVVDLSPFGGRGLTIINFHPWISPSSGPGNWDEYFGDIVLVHANGTSTTVYSRLLTALSASSVSSVSNLSVTTEKAADTNPLTTVTHYSGDQIGSTMVLTDAAGWPVSSDTYYPFGQEANLSADNNHYKFTGKERDTESGNDYFGARYYGSSMGRFMSPDTQDPSDALPFVGIDPIPYADPANPQSFNLYSYVLNNPLENTDRDGHDVNICDNNGDCHQVSNEDYQKAQQGNNGGLNVPTLDQVGSNGNGRGQFNATAITDSSGNTVGTATYVSNGNLDYYANANVYQQLATASRATNQVTAVYSGVYGTLLAGAVAAGPAADLIAAQRYRAALEAWKALSKATGAAGLIGQFFKTGVAPPGLTPQMVSAYLDLAKTYIAAGLGTAGGIMQSGIGTQANRIQQLENYLGR